MSVTSTERDPWYIFDGSGTDRSLETPDIDRLKRLPPPPPWRRFEHLDGERARSFLPDREHVEHVNTALYLRRPLLITGKPGSGKTTLAYAVARELGLGPVLRWSITSRSTLLDGLYQYDAVARLQDVHLEREARKLRRGNVSVSADALADGTGKQDEAAIEDIGRYLTLGPLGTAFFAKGPIAVDGVKRWFPRVLLIDEIDKSDIDLPNDLLHVFEEGRFEIPELVRLKQRQPEVNVRAWGENADTVTVIAGEVRCREFPLVIMTNNGEREFPPAFLRRCLPLRMEPPKKERLEQIVRSHLFSAPQDSDEGARLLIEEAWAGHSRAIDDLIGEFLRRRDSKRLELATDQLLNAMALTMSGVDLSGLIGAEDDGILSTVFSPLTGD